MIKIVDPRIVQYLDEMAPEKDPRILAMENEAKASGFPIVDRQVGRLLYLLTRLKQPKLVVELGSGFGYSAYWFARAISIGGKVVLTDHSEERIEQARVMFQEAGLNHRAEFRVGDAIDIGCEYEEIDLLFIDLDKYLYVKAIEAMVPVLSRNALVVADNTLWYGSVVDRDDDRDSEGIRAFNEYMFNRRDFFTTILPVRDGVMLAYRLD